MRETVIRFWSCFFFFFSGVEVEVKGGLDAVMGLRCGVRSAFILYAEVYFLDWEWLALKQYTWVGGWLVGVIFSMLGRPLRTSYTNNDTHGKGGATTPRMGTSQRTGGYGGRLRNTQGEKRYTQM